MKRRLAMRIAAVTICTTIQASGQAQPTSKRPEDAGFSPERLKRIAQVFQSDVAKGEIPGAVLAIGRNGSVPYLQAFGYQDRAKKTPMKADSIFRIASMSKPITPVAIMMLTEEGKIDIAAPVSQYLPEFKDLRVGMQEPETPNQSMP